MRQPPRRRPSSADRRPASSRESRRPAHACTASGGRSTGASTPPAGASPQRNRLCTPRTPSAADSMTASVSGTAAGRRREPRGRRLVHHRPPRTAALASRTAAAARRRPSTARRPPASPRGPASPRSCRCPGPPDARASVPSGPSARSATAQLSGISICPGCSGERREDAPSAGRRPRGSAPAACCRARPSPSRSCAGRVAAYEQQPAVRARRAAAGRRCPR